MRSTLGNHCRHSGRPYTSLQPNCQRYSVQASLVHHCLSTASHYPVSQALLNNLAATTHQRPVPLYFGFWIQVRAVKLPDLPNKRQKQASDIMSSTANNTANNSRQLTSIFRNSPLALVRVYIDASCGINPVAYCNQLGTVASI